MNTETGIDLLAKRMQRLEADLAECRALAASQQQVIDANAETISQMRNAESLLRQASAPPQQGHMRTHARQPRDRHGLHVVKVIAPVAALGAAARWVVSRKAHKIAAAATVAAVAGTGAWQVMPDHPGPVPRAQAGVTHHHARRDRNWAVTASPSVAPQRSRRQGRSQVMPAPGGTPDPYPDPPPYTRSPAPQPDPSPSPLLPSPAPSVTLPPLPLPTPTPSHGHGHKHKHCLPVVPVCLPGL